MYGAIFMMCAMIDVLIICIAINHYLGCGVAHERTLTYIHSKLVIVVLFGA